MALELAAAARSRLGKYRILRQLGAGAMGAVYHAVDEDTGVEVALKLLPPDAAGDAKRVERFQREGQHGARLHHENIVAVHEAGELEGEPFLALEYVDGVDLDHYL